jgi:hypothetical protein
MTIEESCGLTLAAEGTLDHRTFGFSHTSAVLPDRDMGRALAAGHTEGSADRVRHRACSIARPANDRRNEVDEPLSVPHKKIML